MGKNETYELESLLLDLKCYGFVTVPLHRLLRLLGKGNRAAGTWRALLDSWEEVGGAKDEIHAHETPREVVILSTSPTENLRKWAGE